MADTTTITYESRFCRQCDNLMHILTDDDGASRYKCRTCQGTSDMTGVDRVVVLRREYNRSTTRDELSDDARRIMVQDPTYARIRQACIDPKCTATHAVFTKLRGEAMRFRYVCCSVDGPQHTWTNRLAGNTLQQ